LTFFEGLDAIRSFAGSDYETAVVAEEARMVLIRFDERVCHDQTAVEASPVLITSVGQDSGETPRTFLDEEGFLPILIQHLQPVDLDPAGGLAGPGGDRVGRSGRGDSTGPEGGVGAMEEGGDLLELFGSDLVPHRQSPAWNRGSILPPALCVHPVF
jgi:hypothetical protein